MMLAAIINFGRAWYRLPAGPVPYQYIMRIEAGSTHHEVLKTWF